MASVDSSTPSSSVPNNGKKMQYRKTKYCPWHDRGRCFMGETCNYAHGRPELRPKPNLFKTKLCPESAKGVQCTKSDCRFAHDFTELQATSAFFKTKLCKFWLKGNCPAGMECRHAHGQEELRNPEGRDDAPPPPPVTKPNRARVANKRTTDPTGGPKGSRPIPTKAAAVIPKGQPTAAAAPPTNCPPPVPSLSLTELQAIALLLSSEANASQLSAETLARLLIHRSNSAAAALLEPSPFDQKSEPPMKNVSISSTTDAGTSSTEELQMDEFALETDCPLWPPWSAAESSAAFCPNSAPSAWTIPESVPIFSSDWSGDGDVVDLSGAGFLFNYRGEVGGSIWA